MKRVSLFFIVIVSAYIPNISAQDYYYGGYTYETAKGAYHNDLEFIIHGGSVFSNLRYGSSTSFDLGMDYTPYEASDQLFSYSFITDFSISKDYWSINPLGATSIVLILFCKNVIDDNETVHTILKIMAGESMSLNFALTKHFEIAPYWNLLRLSNWQKGATYLTGEVGGRLNYYFGSEDRWSLRAKACYSWGYGNADYYSEKLYNIFGDSGESTDYYKYQKPFTPFKGWNFGISLGYRL